MARDKFILSGGQSHMLEGVFHRTGWDTTTVNMLADSKNAALVKEFLLGRAKIEIMRHVVDFESSPSLPYSQFQLLPEDQPANRVTGTWEIDPKAIKTLLTGDVKAPYGRLTGKTLVSRLADKKVFGAQLLDYLIDHPEALPYEWTQKAAFDLGRTIVVYFLGTVYRGPRGTKYVRGFNMDGPRSFVVTTAIIDADNKNHFFGGNFSAVATL